MKKYVFGIALLAVLVLLFSHRACTRSEVDVEKGVAEAVSGGTICFADIYKGRDWDSLYVLKPYGSIDSLHIEMRDADRAALESILSYDESCAVLFVRRGHAVAYARISRDIVDFAQVGTNGFPRDYRFHVKGNVATAPR